MRTGQDRRRADEVVRVRGKREILCMHASASSLLYYQMRIKNAKSPDILEISFLLVRPPTILYHTTTTPHYYEYYNNIITTINLPLPYQ